MEKENEKQKEFERLLTAYIEKGQVPKDINAKKILQELREMEDEKIIGSIKSITAKTKEYLSFLHTMEATFESGSFDDLWDGIMQSHSEILRGRLKDEMRKMIRETEKISRKLDLFPLYK